MQQAIAIAHPNIAFIKYWGDKNTNLKIPANNSISMNLDGLCSTTEATIDPSLNQDIFTLNGEKTTGVTLERVTRILSLIRKQIDKQIFFHIKSKNNFPTGVGLASSASGFASLVIAATSACGLKLDQPDLSRLARIGSGSACRSIPGGFVEWKSGRSHKTSYAYSIAPAKHWDIIDCIAIIDTSPKKISSHAGHKLAPTSPLYKARLYQVNKELELCRQAIHQRDFKTLTRVAELDCSMMHAVMMTSNPSLFYWNPETISLIKTIRTWQEDAISVSYTIDAGPNVHILCTSAHHKWVMNQLNKIHSIQQVICAKPGGPARLLT